ncbi:MAG: hypothetical protein ACYDH9_20675 [Limisphaerales bacterium]
MKQPNSGPRAVSARFSVREFIRTYAQRRRRWRARHRPAAPLITGHSYEWDDGAAVVRVYFTFDHGNYPTDTIECWTNCDGGPWNLFETIYSTELEWVIQRATEVPATIGIRLRYQHGPLYGPWSNTDLVVVSAP